MQPVIEGVLNECCLHRCHAGRASAVEAASVRYLVPKTP